MKNRLNGLYVITDNILTPNKSIINQVEEALKGGARIIQLRDKENSTIEIKRKAKALQKICKKYNATFILNDEIDLAIKLKCDGIHIGKSDYHRIDEIRKDFGGIIGISCYGDIKLAKEFEKKGIDYVAFGSFYKSPTKPLSNIVQMEVLEKAKKELNIPICAIGGLNSFNIDEIIKYKPNMISLISDIWESPNIFEKCKFYSNYYEENR